MIDAIFTDLDGVIRHWNDEQITRMERAFGLPRGAFWQIVFDPVLVQQAVTGAITDDEWRKEGGRRLRTLYPDVDIGGVLHSWDIFEAEIDTVVVDLLRECRHHVPVALITNATTRLPADLTRLGLADTFDFVFNTSEMGVAKPVEAVFRQSLRRVGVRADRSFFVDDRWDNVAAAARVGMHAHLFQGVAPLSEALRQLGLPVTKEHR